MAASVRSLGESEELVTQFCAVTGSDHDTGRRLLDVCNGNLEMAIGMYMDQEETQGSESARPSGSGLQSGHSSRIDAEPGAAAMASSETDLNGVRAPIPQRHEVLVEDVLKLGGFRGRRRNVRSVFDGFRNFQTEARQQESMMVTGRSFVKKNTLEDLFRPPIDITYKGTFKMARDFGTAQKKWLMVNIQNVQEFSCQVLNRDIWSDIAVKGLLKNNFVFWQVYHDSEEGKKYMQFYKVLGWPHVAVIDPVTGESLASWKKIEVTTFPALVREFLSDHPNPETADETPPAKRSKRSDSILDENEEAQLEAAIRASLSQQANTSDSSPKIVSSPYIEVDSDDLEKDSDDLETFTGSEDESSDAPARSHREGSRDRTPTRRTVSHARSAISLEGGRGRGGLENVASSSAAAGAASSPRLVNPGHSDSPPNSSAPGNSRSIGRNFAQAVVDSENENSQGFRESFANTPNSVDLLGSRSSECHIIDSSSNSSSSTDLVTKGSSSAVTVDLNDLSSENDCFKLSSGDGGIQEGKSSSSESWQQHLGNDYDPKTKLIFRFPDGQKEQLSIPCSSTLEALFAFCSSKGFGVDSFELVVNFPRRSLSSLSSGSTLKEANLHPQETIFIQAR